MAKFCQNCGAPLNEGAKFCPTCGAGVGAPAPQPQQPQQPAYQQPQPAYTAPTYAAHGDVRQGIPAPGYSDRVNHPEILAAVKKNKRAAAIFAAILVPLPLIGFLVYSLVSGKMEPSSALLYGGIVSGVFLVFALVRFAGMRKGKTYEGTVTEKTTRTAYRRDGGNDRSRESYIEYVTCVSTASGKKKIVEREGGMFRAWDYLKVGDRFLYHPQFNFPYELYDKSRAPFLVCIRCNTQNPVEADRCKKCGLPLLK
ncbi:MAG: zinc-ribbon domain-containing protein [Clostridia bacterium]|nr:zinc-ribbon domain-containing protein [Clostridia bacterium]